MQMTNKQIILNNFQRVWCVDSPGFGGAEITLLRVMKMLGVSDDIVLGSINGSDLLVSQIQTEGIEYRAIFNGKNGIRAFAKGLFLAFACVRAFRNSCFIVWCHHADSNRWLQFGLALLKARFIIVERLIPAGTDAFARSRLTIPLKRFVSRRAKIIVVNGYSQVKNYSILFSVPESKIKVIPNSRPILEISNCVQILRENRKRLRDELGLMKNSKIILCVARLSEEKGQSILIESMSKLGNVSQAIQLVFVGEGEARSGLVAEAKMINNVDIKFVGYKNDILPYLAAADVFVLPSLAEGLPGALLEAMAAALPCVVSNIPGNCELIIDDETGLIFQPKQSRPLAVAIDRILEDQKLAMRLGEKGRELVMNFYNEKTEKAEWINLMKSIQ